MKQYTSRFLKVVAILFMAFPATYLLVVALLFDVTAKQCVRLLLSPAYYILSIIAVVAGYGLWEMKRWAWYVFVAINVFLIYFDAVVVSDHGETHHKILAFVFATCCRFLLVSRVTREIRVPYFLPKIRWWESNPRYKLAVPVTIRRTDNSAVDGEILDLSMGGCFVKLRAELSANETLALQFVVFGQSIDCTGMVVWRTQSTVTHPKGVGVKFDALGRQQKRSLRAITQRLRKIASFYRSSRYLINQEEFRKRYDELASERLKVGKLAAAQATAAPQEIKAHESE